MKKLLFLELLFLVPIEAISQTKCEVRILREPPSIFFEIEMRHNDDVLISQYPDAKSKIIIDTFLIYDICTDNGVTMMHSFIAHEKPDEYGFRDSYQIVYSNDTEPLELEGISPGDSIFMKITPFYKANRMPGGLIVPIQLDGVWMEIPQSGSDNIYRLDITHLCKRFGKRQ